MTPAPTYIRNFLLRSLPAADIALLRPHLRTVELQRDEVLAEAGERIVRVYFPHSGVISLVVGLGEGEMVEAAMIGRDSVFGASAALGGGASVSHAIVRLPGEASTLDAEYLRIAAERSAPLRTTLARHAQALFAQAQQSAACNACHTVESRLSRCLSRLRDLSGGDSLPITQESLSQMLGVRRNSVSIVAHALQQAGLIRYSRGAIEIADSEGLRGSACECYGAVKTYCDRLLGGQELRRTG